MVERLLSTLNSIRVNWPLLKRTLRSAPIQVLIVALWKNSEYILFGNEKMIERLKVCETCEFQHKEFCLLCGCHIPAAVLHKSHKCPAGRWKE